MTTNHEELMRRLEGLLDVPEDVMAAIIDEVLNVAAANNVTVEQISKIGYQDFAALAYPGPAREQSCQ